MYKVASGDKIYIYDILSEEGIGGELDALMDIIPPWRKQKVLSYRNLLDRYLCAKAYWMLRDGLMRDYGIYDEIRFAYNYYGKPFLPDHPEIHFNLSHCKKGIACAVSDVPVGIDIEEIQYDDDMARYVLDAGEYERVSSSDNPAEEFTKIWTRKESYVKMLGTGLPSQLSSLVIPDSGFTTQVNREAGYVVSRFLSKSVAK